MPAAWTQDLPTLAERLKTEAPRRRGAWLSYLLPGGALVAARMEHTGIVIRIARRHASRDRLTLKARALWESEVGTFARKLDVTDWTLEHEQDHTDGEGRVTLAVRFLQTARPPHARPGQRPA